MRFSCVACSRVTNYPSHRRLCYVPSTVDTDTAYVQKQNVEKTKKRHIRHSAVDLQSTSVSLPFPKQNRNSPFVFEIRQKWIFKEVTVLDSKRM